MSENEFNSDTLTNSQCEAIKAAWKYAYPDMASDVREPYVQQRVLEFKNNKQNGLFIFGNFIYFDSERDRFIIRIIVNLIDDEDGNFQTEEDSIHSDIKSVIHRIIIRQAQCRVRFFFENEYDDDGNEIPFSSRYECAIHGRKHKEYDCD